MTLIPLSITWNAHLGLGKSNLKEIKCPIYLNDTMKEKEKEPVGIDMESI